MSAQLIDGKALAREIRARLRQVLENTTREAPGLATVLVGDDPASHIYVRNKRRACAEVGIRSLHEELDATTSEAALIDRVRRLNEDPSVHGILVQQPLPSHIRADLVVDAISPAKDVDGYHPANLGALCANREGLRPCTPLAVMRLLDEAKVELQGKEALVIGRSAVVGKPSALLLLGRHASVTIAHSRSRDLGELGRRAEVLVAAVGRAELVQGDWVREGAVVIDVGINRRDDGRLVGDVAFEEAARRARAITPVPGGVGPMTIAMLLCNTLKAAGFVLPEGTLPR